MYSRPVIYFDHNATSPLCAAAREAWLSAIERFPANPSSSHRLGSRAEAALDGARHSIARHLGCSPLDLVWTSGATEANNSVLYHASLDSSNEVWVSRIEHPSVMEPVVWFFGKRVRFIPVTASGVIELDWIAGRLKTGRPALVFVMAANNETGVLQPWREALRICRQHETPFGCDAAQWIGKLSAAGLGECDYVTGCAHKFGGPAGVGFMKVPPGFRPLLRGGSQEDGRRSGTQNVAGVLAMAAAWDAREQHLRRGEHIERERWRDEFIDSLRRDLPDSSLVGAGAARLWNTASVLLPGLADCRRRWVVLLDKAGFAASTGSACASGKEKPSHVFTAMGYGAGDTDRIVRFSSGWQTPEADWIRLRSAILKLAASRGASAEATRGEG